jgi:protease-4
LLQAIAAPAAPAAPAKDKQQSEKPSSAKGKAAEKPAAKEAEPAPKKLSVVLLTVKGQYPEGPSAPGLFSELEPSLGKLIRRIDEAAEDDSVGALWLRVEPLDVGRAKLHEMRSAVARFRKSGKPVYAELAAADTAQYLLAAACDEVFMVPSGELILPGVRAEVTFFKGLLDKLGIEFDVLQMGKYKGAAEPLTRAEMSPALRESLEALVDDSYEDLAATIAADRGMKDYRVKTLLDKGLFTASAARKAGLVDRVAYADEFRESLRKKLKVDDVELVTDYKKKKVDSELSGMTGVVKLLELLMGGKPSKPLAKQKSVAVVYAVGPILPGKSTSDLFGESTVGATTLIEALRQAADDPNVVAVVLRVDSPGGSAVASDLIWRETVRIEKPLIASMGDVAGSGGYYIAMGADQIFAAPDTITGSIGVVGGKVVLGKLYGKVGLTTEIISRGEKSKLFSASRPFAPEERKALTALLRETYRQFVRKAAEGRKLGCEDLEKLAQGRVYTGRMAAENGLIDELGTLEDAVAAAKKAAGLKPDEKVELLILPRPKTIFEQLFGDAELSTELDDVVPELTEMLRQARFWQRLFAEPSLMWMPFRVKIK